MPTMVVVIPLVTQWNSVKSLEIRSFFSSRTLSSLLCLFLEDGAGYRVGYQRVSLSEKNKGSVATATVSKDGSSQFQSLLLLASSSVLKSAYWPTSFPFPL